MTLKLLLLVIGMYINFHAVGHVLVCHIARKQLSKDTYNKYLNILLQLKDRFEYKYDLFLEGCNIPDVFESQYNHLIQSKFHYYTNMIKESNDTTIYNTDNDINTNFNSLNLLYKSSIIFRNNFKIKKEFKPIHGMLLMYFMHVYGDLHQPAHNGSYYSSKFINGDIGGNIVKTKRYNSIHFSFDSCFEFTNKRFDDIDVNNIKEVEELSQELEDLFPINDEYIQKLLEVKDFKEISNEGLNFLTNVVYSYIKDKSKVVDFSEKYEKLLKNYCLMRIVIGGYRLGQTLNDIINHN